MRESEKIIHDATEILCDWCGGGQGASLFGQTGKVIGVNSGVFTDSNAANNAANSNTPVAEKK